MNAATRAQGSPDVRTREGFPTPIAELVSGPVWVESNLRRFAETWERKPGRPRKEDRRKLAIVDQVGADIAERQRERSSR